MLQIFGVVLFLAAVIRWLGSRSARVGGDSGVFVPWAVMAPAVVGVTLSLLVGGWLNTIERGSSRSVAWLRLGPYLLVFVPSSSLIWTATLNVKGPIGAEGTTRNLVLFSAASLIGVVLLGYEFGWLVPSIWVFSCLTVGAKLGRIRWWAFPLRPDANGAALLVALVLFVLALGLCGLRGAHMQSRGSRE